MNAFGLIEHFSNLQDFRQPWKVEHKLTDIFLLVVCAMIAGARGWAEIEDFGKLRESWLKKMGDLPSVFHHTTPLSVLSAWSIQSSCISTFPRGCRAVMKQLRVRWLPLTGRQSEARVTKKRA